MGAAKSGGWGTGKDSPEVLLLPVDTDGDASPRASPSPRRRAKKAAAAARGAPSSPSRLPASERDGSAAAAGDSSLLQRVDSHLSSTPLSIPFNGNALTSAHRADAAVPDGDNEIRGEPNMGAGITEAAHSYKNNMFVGWCGSPSRCCTSNPPPCCTSTRADYREECCSRLESGVDNAPGVAAQQAAVAAAKRRIERKAEDAAELQRKAEASAFGRPEFGAFHKSNIPTIPILVDEDHAEEEVTYDALANEVRLKNYDNALLICCYYGDASGTREYLEKGGFPLIKDISRFSAGHHAALSGSLPTLVTLLEYDVHKDYAQSFDTEVNSDNMTTLIAVMQAGHHEIYEYLLFEYGAKLALSDKRLKLSGNDDLDKWLRLLPEITNPEHLQRPQTLTLCRYKVDKRNNKRFSQEEFEQAQRDRLRVRAFVRRQLAIAAPSGAVSPAGLLRQGHKRCAVVGSDRVDDAEDSRQVLVVADIAASMVFTANTNTRTPCLRPRTRGRCMATVDQHNRQRDDDSADEQWLKTTPAKKVNCIWVCGNCGTAHSDVEVSKLGDTVLCKACEKKNWVFPPESGADWESENDCDAFGHGEVWDNTGKEFLDETVVSKYMPVFRTSLLMLLGAHRLTDMVRVVKFEHSKAGATLFRKGELANAVYALRYGEVVLVDDTILGGGESESVKVYERDQKQYGVKLIDTAAFLQPSGTYTRKAQIGSGDASIFVFDRTQIAEHCGAETLETIVRDTTSSAVIGAFPFFRLGFQATELKTLMSSLIFSVYKQDDTPVLAGSRPKQLIWVQEGQLEFWSETGLRAERKIYVSPYKANVPQGFSYQQVVMFGLRSVLFSMPELSTIKVRSFKAYAWTLDTIAAHALLVGRASISANILLGLIVDYLHRTPLFRRLDIMDPRLRRVAEAADMLDLWEGDVVIREGGAGDSFFIVLEGTVTVEVHGKAVASLRADLDGDVVQYFGELAVLDGKPRAATVRVETTSAKVLQVFTETITDIFVAVERLLAEQGVEMSTLLREELGKHNPLMQTKGTKGIQRSASDALVPEAIAWVNRAADKARGGKPTEGGKEKVVSKKGAANKNNGSSKLRKLSPASPRLANKGNMAASPTS